MSEYIAKFKELCKFFTIYQHNPDENWKCIKFEDKLKVDIPTSVGPMEIRDFAALVNKSRLVEEYNKKFVDTSWMFIGRGWQPKAKNSSTPHQQRSSFHIVGMRVSNHKGQL